MSFRCGCYFFECSVPSHICMRARSVCPSNFDFHRRWSMSMHLACSWCHEGKFSRF